MPYLMPTPMLRARRCHIVAPTENRAELGAYISNEALPQTAEACRASSKLRLPCIR